MFLNPSPIFSKPFVLIGLPKSGKTTLGKLLSSQHGLKFADLDQSLEHKFMMPRRELFQKYKEPFFRKEELSQFEELLLDGYDLISVGGGAHIEKDLRRYKLVWLKLPINIIQARIDPEAPYLKGVCFEDWMYQRQKNYADKAQIEVELTGVDLYADANRLWQAIHLAGISH